MMTLKQRIWIFSLNFFKIKEGQILPKYMILIRFIIFPLNTLWHWMARKYDVYDVLSNRYKIHNKYYSDKLFLSFSNYGLPIGTTFKIIEKENETITIERIT